MQEARTESQRRRAPTMVTELVALQASSVDSTLDAIIPGVARGHH